MKTPTLGLAQQFTLSKQLYDAQLNVQKTLQQLRDRRTRATQLPDFDKKLAALEGRRVDLAAGALAKLMAQWSALKDEAPRLNLAIG